MTAPTWVLLRGLGRESGHWGTLPAQLAAQVAPAVVALDLPGTGTRHRETCPAQVAAIADACRAELLRRGTAPPYVLLGLSLGGMVALDWSDRCADEVAGCVAINTSARDLGAWHERLRPAAAIALLATRLLAGARRAEATVLRRTSADPARHAGALDTWVALRRRHPVAAGNLLRQLLAAARWRVPAAAPPVPLLLLGSAADRLVAPACTRRLAQRWQVPHAEHPHAGHDLPLDAPQWLIAQLLAFTALSPAHHAPVTPAGDDGRR